MSECRETCETGDTGETAARTTLHMVTQLILFFIFHNISRCPCPCKGHRAVLHFLSDNWEAVPFLYAYFVDRKI